MESKNKNIANKYFSPIKELEDGTRYIAIDLDDFDLSCLDSMVLNKNCFFKIKEREDKTRYCVKYYSEDYSSVDASNLNSYFVSLIKDIINNNFSDYKFILTRNSNTEVSVYLTRLITKKDLKEDEEYLDKTSKAALKKKIHKMSLYRNLDSISFDLSQPNSSVICDSEKSDPIESKYIKYIPYKSISVTCGSEECMRSFTSEKLLSLFDKHNENI